MIKLGGIIDAQPLKDDPLDPGPFAREELAEAEGFGSQINAYPEIAVGDRQMPQVALKADRLKVVAVLVHRPKFEIADYFVLEEYEENAAIRIHRTDYNSPGRTIKKIEVLFKGDVVIEFDNGVMHQFPREWCELTKVRESFEV